MLRPVIGSETGRLIREMLEGNRTAREALLGQLQPRLTLWAASRLSDAMRARLEPGDAAQEIMLTVHRDLDRFEGSEPKAFTRWLFTVAENKLTDLARYEGAKKRQPRELREETQTSPSVRAARQDALDRMVGRLAKLSVEDRGVIRMRYLEELSYEEVAAALQVSVGTARVRVCRALQALREEMSEEVPHAPR